MEMKATEEREPQSLHNMRLHGYELVKDAPVGASRWHICFHRPGASGRGSNVLGYGDSREQAMANAESNWDALGRP